MQQPSLSASIAHRPSSRNCRISRSGVSSAPTDDAAADADDALFIMRARIAVLMIGNGDRGSAEVEAEDDSVFRGGSDDDEEDDDADDTTSAGDDDDAAKRCVLMTGTESDRRMPCDGCTSSSPSWSS